MDSLIYLFILIPLIGVLASVICPPKNERVISWVALTTVGLQFTSFIIFFAFWLLGEDKVIKSGDIILYHTFGYKFYIEFLFDKVSAVYLFVGSFIACLVTIYSRYYLHREDGYKRYFNTILFFYLGYNTVVLSGNLETLFVGWEILGISSFMLIAFYRFRYLPVKNAIKVFSIYRIGDVGLILAMWSTHHFWHTNITFSTLGYYDLVQSHIETHSLVGVFISLMILLSACAKSAQLPFSSWLPRAMEGPTPSSAIFYGSLAVHIGVFLLLRTFPFWEHQLSVRILIGVVGLLTSIMATGIARVQSSIKSQIAYSSVAQIGLIFIEVAAGFENIALFHFAGNAFLRTYQLLVSPSVVTYLIREKFYNFVPRKDTFEDSIPKKLENTFYILCIKEWNLDWIMYRLFWSPLKGIGKKLSFLSKKIVILIFSIIYLVGLYEVYHQETIPSEVQKYLPIVFSVIGLMMILKSFALRGNAYVSWTLLVMSHFWIVMAVAFNEYFKFDQVHFYLSGIIVSAILGYLCLWKLKQKEINSELNQFHGYAYEHPKIGFMFLISCLGLAGFPITPTFIGEDLIFTHIHDDQPLLAFIISLSFIVIGISLIRIYARLFLGPHVKSIREMAYRSS
jgi:NADH:ubiquinone oxidoreductase subunit 5 (subunit L)/multisubunit Na+/H+ antiporter MnhA subunit